MIQSLAFPVSDYRYLPQKSWEGFGEALKELGLDGLELLGNGKRLWEPIPQSMVQGYQMRAPLDWLDCYLGEKDRYIWNVDTCEEVEDAFHQGTREDILTAYREDLSFGLSLNTPYIVFDVSNADERETYTWKWTHSDHWVMDAAIEILNGLLKGIKPSFYLLLGNNRWPGFNFLDPKKTEYLLTRIDFPKVGIMLDTGRLLSTKPRTRNQEEGIKYIHSLLDKHGELCKSILGLHFNYISTSEWSRSRFKAPERKPGDWHPSFMTEEKTLRYRVRRFEYHTAWTYPGCVSLIDRIEPWFLVHTFYHTGSLTRMGALTRQRKAIQKGRDLKTHGSAGTDQTSENQYKDQRTCI